MVVLNYPHSRFYWITDDGSYYDMVDDDEQLTGSSMA